MHSGNKNFGFGGFSIQKKSSGADQQMNHLQTSGKFNVARPHHFVNIGKRKLKSEEDYFDDGDEDKKELEYLPLPGSPSNNHEKADDSDKSSDSDSDDPLEKFMEDIEKEVKEQDLNEIKKKGKRDDIEIEDDQESYFRYMEENPMAGILANDDDLIDYDEEGNPIMPIKKFIDPLPLIDHSEIVYPEFNKNFYLEHEEIKNLSNDQAQSLRDKLGLKVLGIQAPKPVSSFAHFGFDEKLMKSIRKHDYTQPTPIQAQGIPIALSGRDIIGMAKTGSGKTAAYIWPLLIHIMDQNEIKPGDGPIGLIVAPTRELSQQIYNEARKFGKIYNIRVICAYGGGNLYEQTKACEEGAEIIVGTPGRLIELIKKKAISLTRVTYLVYDEADKMFDMGFEPQVRSIADHVRPDRQSLMFSATFKKRVERVARDILIDPIKVVQGDIGEANEDILQIVKIVYTDMAKWNWLTANLIKFTSLGSVLIFVTRKADCEELANNLKERDLNLGVIHGNLNQIERNEVITAFKNKQLPILVATDVAARGLDIPHIRTVINYDIARDIDTHTHRIGRTGRAGEKGTAYTLLSPKDKDFAGQLVRNLEGANQTVSKELMDLAMQNSWFKKNRFQQQKPKKLNIGGAGLGFKEKGPSKKSYNSDINQNLFKSSGPQSERIIAMKSAFQNQFKSNFVSASGHANVAQNYTAWTSSSDMEAIPNQPCEEKKNIPVPVKKVKKSRWE